MDFRMAYQSSTLPTFFEQQPENPTHCLLCGYHNHPVLRGVQSGGHSGFEKIFLNEPVQAVLVICGVLIVLLRVKRGSKFMRR
jgi:hypothetical protein